MANRCVFGTKFQKIVLWYRYLVPWYYDRFRWKCHTLQKIIFPLSVATGSTRWRQKSGILFSWRRGQVNASWVGCDMLCEWRGRAGGRRHRGGAVGVGGCARLPSSAAGMRSVSSTRLRCAWTLWAVSGNPSGIPGSTMGLATGTSARLRAGHDVWQRHNVSK